MNKLTPSQKTAIALCVGAIAVIVGYKFWKPASPMPPNILLLTLDTTRADRIGCYGYSKARTPHLDRLAEQGVRFDRAFTPVPITLPSHVSILSGLYPAEHGLHANGAGALNPDTPWLPERLKEAGYHTAGFVSANVLSADYGLSRGFSTFSEDEIERPSISTVAGYDLPVDLYQTGDITAAKALSWLKSHVTRSPDRPFFCWVHFFDPHTPVHPRRELWDQPFEEDYDAEVAFMDIQIGRLVEFLNTTGLRSNTLVIAVGDHGEGLGDHGESTHAYMLYNSTVHVPLVISRPSTWPAGQVVNDPVNTMDLYYTIADVLGLDFGQPASQEGVGIHRRSLKQTLNSRNDEAVLYLETDHPYVNCGWNPLRGWMEGPWKYIRSTLPELYRLDLDPLELTNVWSDYPDVAQTLESRMRSFESSRQTWVAEGVELTDEERKRFASLGYVAAGGGSMSHVDQVSGLPDIKERIHLVDKAATLDARIKFGQDPEQNRIDAEALVEADPENPVFHYWMGLVAANQRRPFEAINALSRAIDLLDAVLIRDPAHVVMRNYLYSALDYRGVLRAQMDEWDEAEADFEKAMVLDPDKAAAHHHLGLVYAQRGRLTEAREKMEQALRLNPDLTHVRRNLELLEQGAPPVLPDAKP